MKRETVKHLKALDMDVIRAVLVLDNLIRQRAALDQPSTMELVEEINKSLLEAAQAPPPAA